MFFERGLIRNIRYVLQVYTRLLSLKRHRIRATQSSVARLCVSVDFIDDYKKCIKCVFMNTKSYEDFLFQCRRKHCTILTYKHGLEQILVGSVDFN